MQHPILTSAINLATARAAAGNRATPPLNNCKSIRYAHVARAIFGAFQSQAGLGRAFLCGFFCPDDSKITEIIHRATPTVQKSRNKLFGIARWFQTPEQTRRAPPTALSYIKNLSGISNDFKLENNDIGRIR